MYENQFDHAAPQTEIACVGAYFVEVPSGQPLHYRPLSIDSGNGLITDLQNATEGGLHIDQAALRSIAREIVTPSVQSKGSILIQNGWDTNRCSVYLMFRVTTPRSIYHEVLTGYTDNNNITEGYVAPDIRIFINSVIRVSEQQRRTNQGAVTTMVAQENAQVLRPIVIDNAGQQSQGSIGLRPTDVLTGWANNFGRVDVDVRSSIAGNVDGEVGIASRRSNGISSHYLSKALTSFSLANNGENDSMANNDRWIAGKSATEAREKSLTASHLFSLLKNRTSLAEAGCFTMSQLQGAMPFAPGCIQTRLIPRGAMRIGVNTQTWGDYSEETQIGVKLANAVPAISGHNMISNFKFKATNITGAHVVLPQNIQMLFPGASEQAFTHQLMLAMQHSILPEIFDGVCSYYDIECEYAVGGVMMISISVNGQPHVPYEMPNYCDALAASTIATEQREVDNNGHHLGELLSRTFTGVTAVTEPTRWG